jgi:hypothetical protein
MKEDLSFENLHELLKKYELAGYDDMLKEHGKEPFDDAMRNILVEAITLTSNALNILLILLLGNIADRNDHFRTAKSAAAVLISAKLTLFTTVSAAKKMNYDVDELIKQADEKTKKLLDKVIDRYARNNAGKN